MFVFPQNSDLTLTPSVAAFKNGVSEEVIKVK